MPSFRFYRTNISQAFWCSLADGQASFRPAVIPGDHGPDSIAWFDELFKGGLRLPSGGDKPITMLITGPPGSGKTTLAMEICYRLARNEPAFEGADRPNSESLFSLYISTDQEAERLIDNARSYGYEDVDLHIVDFARDDQKPEEHDVNRVAVWGQDRIRQQLDQTKADNLAEIVIGAVEILGGVLARVRATPTITKALRDRIARLFYEDPGTAGSLERLRPDIIVVDSLNIVPQHDQEDFFQKYIEATSSGGKLVIFVLDSASADQRHEIWEYACDIVVRLDYGTRSEYYLRTVEIVKARYQSHVWGVQQLKIYEEPDLKRVSDAPTEDLKAWNERLRRGHPYRREGGIFIYPSIHYYLSRYKRRGPTTAPMFASTRPELTGVLDRGFPEGRCTAFIGTRGGHKSHFGYLHLLHRLLGAEDQDEVGVGSAVLHDGEAALVVSLRDDERMTTQTITSIMATEFDHVGNVKEAGRILEDLRRLDRLEVLYYHPGNITPEEFFHRMFVSIHRLKRGGRKLTVLFNSLDQLKSRFPLCAEQKIFVPGIIEFLSGEGATSIFIAVDEPGQPAEQYGLLPMADLILAFYPRRFRFDDYYNHLNEVRKLDGAKGELRARIAEMREDRIQFIEEIVLQVVRFAGGQRAGAQGLLELVDDTSRGLYERAGLQFTQLSAKHHLGFPSQNRVGMGPEGFGTPPAIHH